ncbi:MAG: Ig-like domain-containing protein [Gammaproteobacteria bacterium]|nr:Ig-like domain-containing protein [Gammaproteobacteria bacterium]
MCASTAWAGDLILSLEEPTTNSTYTGVANIRGWAVGSAGIHRVELYVDGALKTNIPIGGRRTDVGAAYPSYPNSADSGFSMAFNYSGLAAGQHTIRVRAVDQEGTAKDSSATLNVTRFDNAFILDPARISLDGATISHDSSRSIFINNMSADGKTYDIRLDWRTALQGYAITQIVPTGEQVQDFSGTYRYAVALTSDPCSFSFPANGNATLELQQNGTQLSGNVETTPISGTVDSQGNFSLTAPAEELDTNDPNCKMRNDSRVQGNFISQNVVVEFIFTFFGSAASCSGQCPVIYQGSITKINSAAASRANSTDHEEHSFASMRQALLNNAKERRNLLAPAR